MDRKSFLNKTMAAFLAGIPFLSFMGCGDDDDDDNNDDMTPDETPTETDCGANGTNATINGNHGHTLTVSKEDVAAGVAKTYDIDGSAGHPHSVSVSADDFTALQNNDSVMTESSTGGGHTHGISIVCA